MEEVGIIIPVYNPDQELVKLVRQLVEKGFKTIFVIDDGSDQEHQQPFLEIQKDCCILKNKVNQGKGVALKKGFNYVRQNKIEVKAIVTVDADGQHKIEDIQEVAKKATQIQEGIVLGVRNLKSNQVPFRNRLGNTIASMCFQLKMKCKLDDTQTGLRAILPQYLEEFTKISGNRFEYEINVIKYCAKRGITLHEMPIQAVYAKKQKTYFCAIKDSLKVVLAIWE